MYYQFGKNENLLKFDKDNRLSFDLEAIIKKGATYKNLQFSYSYIYQFVALNQTITIDNITITNTKKSCFYNKLDFIDWGVDLCVFNGVLSQNTEIIDLSQYFFFSLDNNETVPTYNITQNFFYEKLDFFDSETTTQMNILEYLFTVPVVKIKIGNDIYDNHTFVLSKNYTLNYKTDYKLYCFANL